MKYLFAQKLTFIYSQIKISMVSSCSSLTKYLTLTLHYSIQKMIRIFYTRKRDSGTHCGFSYIIYYPIEKCVPVTHTSHETFNLIIYILSIHAILLTCGTSLSSAINGTSSERDKTLERFRYQSRKRNWCKWVPVVRDFSIFFSQLDELQEAKCEKHSFHRHRHLLRWP